ncbi:PAS domain-containing sensor histidine kinase [Virgibacillus phasianinus]|uniref:histidine kinase n=2 Tax=Virgibacillus phasianinus TaxID=2017483 RepID=A0A220U8F9_9BACI|nr:PAS domain-containing sensor histidine kinase [Virgibacillus phasianinus]
MSCSDKTMMKQGIYANMSELPPYIITWIENNSNELISIWDNKGKVMFLSKSVERILGYPLDDLGEVSWYDFLSSEDVSHIRNYFTDDEKDHNNHKFNINIRNKLGKYIWTECVVSKIISDESGKFFYISMVKDISDKKEAEEMMIRSEKMSVAGQLAAGIAHEIRNPLTSLKGFMQLLQAGVNRKEEYYKIMIDEIEKMETITSELLFISKPLTDNRKEENVEVMVHEIVALLLPQARLKNVEINWKRQEKHKIYCDRSQIKQVLINIVKNAIEAMVAKGEIEITISASDSELEIAIIDDGPGIPEEIIHKLGEPFFTTKKSGTGLGLMITKQILEKHNGRLAIEQNISKGSTFKIILPLPSD